LHKLRFISLCAAAFTLGVLPASIAHAQDGSTPTAPGVYAIPGTAQNPTPTPDNAPVEMQTDVTPAQKMPLPIRDDRKYSMTLFDLLEYRPKGKDSDVRWDIESWHGGDYKRFVVKTEGEIATRSNDYNAEFQLLRSRLRKPYTELQYGLRLQAKRYKDGHIARPQAVLALESRVPYNFDVETSLYLDPKGNLSGDFTATKDILLSQRLILQGRLEAAAALQSVERFGVGRGLNSIETGLRLRYEIKREFAPYIGISYNRSYGQTASFIREDGGKVAQWRFVAGVRAWF
jgi:copper resistance protein B